MWGACAQSFCEIENSMLIVVAQWLWANSDHFANWLSKQKSAFLGLCVGVLFCKKTKSAFLMSCVGVDQGDVRQSGNTQAQVWKSKIECSSFDFALCRQRPLHAGNMPAKFERRRYSHAHRRCGVPLG
jgi:hypothetical protein